MKRKVKRPFDNEQFRKGYVAGIFAAEKELNTELLHFAEKAHKIMSEGTFPDYGVKINFKDSNNIITTNLDMKTEEKAKKYDEALEWMRELYPGLHGATKEDAERYFPELKESEDERIRKFIYSIIDNLEPKDFVGVKKMTVLAWLERQKEQPKEELVYRMNGLMQEYIKEGEDDAEKEHRLKCYQLFWDALEDADFFEQKEQKPTTINQDEKEFLADEITAFLCNYDKEFDGEDPVPSEVAEHFYLLGKQAQEQKPVEWSEEDERMLLSIINAFRNGAVSTIGQEQWLKSLPERFNLQPKQEWSEKDLQHKSWILECLADEERKMPEYAEDFRAAYKWLKSLHPQPKQEWGEKEQTIIEGACNALEIHGHSKLASKLRSLCPQSKNEEPKHTEVWVEGRTIFEQDAN